MQQISKPTAEKLKTMIDDLLSYTNLSKTQIPDYAREVEFNASNIGDLIRAAAAREDLLGDNIGVATELSIDELNAISLVDRGIPTSDSIFSDPEVAAMGNLYKSYLDAGLSKKESIERAHDDYSNSIGEATALDNIERELYDPFTGQWRDNATFSRDRHGDEWGKRSGSTISDAEKEYGKQLGDQDLGLDGV